MVQPLDCVLHTDWPPFRLTSIQTVHGLCYVNISQYKNVNDDVAQFPPSLQLTLHEAAQTRLRHTTTAISLEPGRTRVIMFGGCPNWQWGKSGYEQQKLAKTAILEFGGQSTHTSFSFPFWLAIQPSLHTNRSKKMQPKMLHVCGACCLVFVYLLEALFSVNG